MRENTLLGPRGLLSSSSAIAVVVSTDFYIAFVFEEYFGEKLSCYGEKLSANAVLCLRIGDQHQ